MYTARRQFNVASSLSCLVFASVLLRAQAPDAFEEAVHLLQATIDARTRPLTFDIPTGKTNWKLSIYRLPTGRDDGVIYAFASTEHPTFYLQALFCSGPKISDATLLGPTETPIQFLNSNRQYPIFVDHAEYALCQFRGMRAEITINSQPGKTIYFSEERAVRHMCNWAAYFAIARNEPERASEFLFGVMAWAKAVLSEAKAKNDNEKISDEIYFYDRVFPFAVLEGAIATDSKVRSQAQSWLAPSLAARRKLLVFEPELRINLARDETLLRRLSGYDSERE